MKSYHAFPILFKQYKKKQTFLLMSLLVLLNLLWIKEVPPSYCLREAVAVSWQWFKNSKNNKTEKQNKTTLKTKQKKSISGDFSKSLNLVPGSSASFQDHFHTGMRAGSSTSERDVRILRMWLAGRRHPSWQGSNKKTMRLSLKVGCHQVFAELLETVFPTHDK